MPASSLPQSHAEVGRCVIRLLVGGKFTMESNIADGLLLLEMLRTCTEAVERKAGLPPGRWAVEGLGAKALIPESKFEQKT